MRYGTAKWAPSGNIFCSSERSPPLSHWLFVTSTVYLYKKRDFYLPGGETCFGPWSSAFYVIHSVIVVFHFPNVCLLKPLFTRHVDKADVGGSAEVFHTSASIILPKMWKLLKRGSLHIFKHYAAESGASQFKDNKPQSSWLMQYWYFLYFYLVTSRDVCVLLFLMWCWYKGLLDTDSGNSHLWSHYPIHVKFCSTYYPITTAHLFEVDYMCCFLMSLSVLTTVSKC